MFTWKDEWKNLLIISAVFLLCYFLPLHWDRFTDALNEGLHLVQWYAQGHVLTCLLPAFLIAGAISVFISQNAVMRYLGAGANKVLAYGVASVSGGILAVCSCTILPLFAGIYRMGAGLGPASAFLYSGPAINVLAFTLTTAVLGTELGIARVVGAVIFSIVIGLAMEFIFRKEEEGKAKIQAQMPTEEPARPLWQTALYFAAMVGILLFANWAPPETNEGIWGLIYTNKWLITATFGVALAIAMVLWFRANVLKIGALALATIVAAFLLPARPDLVFFIAIAGFALILSTSKNEADSEWFKATWDFLKQILPLLIGGVFVAGILLGRPGNEGLIPSEWIASAVGGNSIMANLIASVLGAFMYFATLTEVPILQGLLGNGMGKGPALALLLAGPALSLPNMLVIRSIMGTKKTLVFVALVIAMATVSGLLYGTIF
jgi:uncharacterized membrane protein YraQ (UPF0718 family)